MRRHRLLAALVTASLFVGACAPTDDGGGVAGEPTTTVSDAPTTTIATTTTTTPAPTTTSTTPLTPPEPLPPDPPGPGWELVWSDEFDGPGIDPDNWTYDIGGWGWGNGEGQYYTDRPENARIEQGVLVIEARQERFEDSYYTSARLLTQDLQEFQYGWIEARIQVPEGVGSWPAFWMLGADFSRGADNEANWPEAGEIDIMEHVGREPNVVAGTIHGPGYAGAGGLSRWNQQDEPIAGEFHTYAIDWDESGIRWYFDGEQYYDLAPETAMNGREWVFDKPFFIILNMALGGTFGGPISLETEFPLYLFVDYVRVYQRTDGGETG